MRVCLINPGRTYYEKSSSVSNVDIGLPLGIMYLASFLEKKNHDVKIIDSLVMDEAVLETIDNSRRRYGAPLKIIKSEVEKFKPNIIGVSNLFSSQIIDAVETTKAMREIYPTIPLVIGGPHVTVKGKEFMKKNKHIDFALLGEAENSFSDLLYHIDGKKNITDIDGIIYRKNDNIIENKKLRFIKNLDDLPFPAYHLVDMEKYLSLSEKGIYSRSIDEERSISIITSRGCPYNCIFCSIHCHMGKEWRPHSAQYVIDHIKHVVNKYKIKHIHFEDDNLTLDLKRCGKILDGIIENNLNIKWDTPNGVRADRFNEEIALKMKKSGCTKLTMGVESGDQSVLDNIIQKNLKLENAIKMARICKKFNIPLSAFYVIGFPGERKENIEKTIKFALMLQRKYNVMQGGAFYATPLYGTRLYNICKENSYLTKEITPQALSEATAAYGTSLIKTEDFSPEYLKKANQRLIRANYLNYLYHPTKAIKFLFKNPKIIFSVLNRFLGR
jgi:anaerobic magnesium-protoporphyrin IX monomethyl ester cyclase